MDGVTGILYYIVKNYVRCIMEVMNRFIVMSCLCITQFVRQCNEFMELIVLNKGINLCRFMTFVFYGLPIEDKRNRMCFTLLSFNSMQYLYIIIT